MLEACCQPPLTFASQLASAPFLRGCRPQPRSKPMATPVHFDPQIGEQFLRYARLLAGRGYVHNTLGNMAIRVAHPDYPHGVAYTRHAEISLEEMGIANIVIT